MSGTTRSDRTRCKRRVAATAVGLIVALAASPVVGAEPDNQAAAIAAADGPAQSWLVADMVSGRILAGRNPYGLYAPASTIKALLAMVVLDELNPDAAVRATPSSTDVECSCVGLVPGAVYPIRALLNALMMVSVRNPFMKQCMSALELHSHSYELVGKHLHVKATNPLIYVYSLIVSKCL